jgi:hypothetical protein
MALPRAGCQILPAKCARTVSAAADGAAPFNATEQVTMGALSGSDLDSHFKFDVVDAIERVNAYFVSRLHALIEQDG